MARNYYLYSLAPQICEVQTRTGSTSHRHLSKSARSCLHSHVGAAEHSPHMFQGILQHSNGLHYHDRALIVSLANVGSLSLDHLPHPLLHALDIALQLVNLG